MLALSEWNRRINPSATPWLILGKGPTFSKHRDLDLSQFRTVSLNHVIRELPVDVAHFIDLDALAACADDVRRHAQWLMVPWYPHVDYGPSKQTLPEHFANVPILEEMSRAGRLVYYHHDLTQWYGANRPDAPPGEHLVRVQAFSAEAIVDALGSCGVRTIRTLGIDGSVDYAKAFADLNESTRLANGQQSFDRQFVGIHQLTREYAMDYGTLETPIRVYVGTDESQMVAVKVLEYSIRKYASRPVEVVPMLNLPVPMPKDERNRPRTGFSFSRLLIPKLAGYRGRGIYLDADMLVFGDIAELWDLPMNGCRLHCSRQDQPPAQWHDNNHFQPGRQMSVMLLECAQLDWNIDEIVRGLDSGRYTYEQLMFDMCLVPRDEIGEAIPREWNSLEHFEPGRTRLLHYTDMATQPWRFSTNPHAPIWRAFYREAIEAGAIPRELIEQGLAANHLMPDLRHELQYMPTGRPNPNTILKTDGVASERQRALQLETMALRAEVDIVRRELNSVRGELAQADARRHAIEAEARRAVAECESLHLHYRETAEKLQALHSSVPWKVARAAIRPVRMARNWLRKSA